MDSVRGSGKLVHFKYAVVAVKSGLKRKGKKKLATTLKEARLEGKKKCLKVFLGHFYFPSAKCAFQLFICREKLSLFDAYTFDLLLFFRHFSRYVAVGAVQLNTFAFLSFNSSHSKIIFTKLLRVGLRVEKAKVRSLFCPHFRLLLLWWETFLRQRKRNGRLYTVRLKLRTERFIRNYESTKEPAVKLSFLFIVMDARHLHVCDIGTVVCEWLSGVYVWTSISRVTHTCFGIV